MTSGTTSALARVRACVCGQMIAFNRRNDMENTREQSILRWVVLALSAFAAYKLWQAGRSMFWTVFGIGWVFYWTGGWPFF